MQINKELHLWLAVYKPNICVPLASLTLSSSLRPIYAVWPMMVSSDTDISLKACVQKTAGLACSFAVILHATGSRQGAQNPPCKPWQSQFCFDKLYIYDNDSSHILHHNSIFTTTAYHFVISFVTNLFVLMKWNAKINIAPALIELYWLPFPERIHYKTLLLVYKSINHQGSSYLADMLTPYQLSGALRSSSQHILNNKKRIRNMKELLLYVALRHCSSGSQNLWKF